MIEGRLTDSLFFDNRVLANDCAAMVDTYLKGEKPEISDYEQYDNGTKIVGTVTSDIQLIDKDNYQMLVDDGYYDEDEIMPEATPTPTVTEEPSEDEKDITATPTPTDSGDKDLETTATEEPEATDTPTPTPKDTATPTPSEKTEKGSEA